LLPDFTSKQAKDYSKKYQVFSKRMLFVQKKIKINCNIRGNLLAEACVWCRNTAELDTLPVCAEAAV